MSYSIRSGTHLEFDTRGHVQTDFAEPNRIHNEHVQSSFGFFGNQNSSVRLKSSLHRTTTTSETNGDQRQHLTKP